MHCTSKFVFLWLNVFLKVNKAKLYDCFLFFFSLDHIFSLLSRIPCSFGDKTVHWRKKRKKLKPEMFPFNYTCSCLSCHFLPHFSIALQRINILMHTFSFPLEQQHRLIIRYTKKKMNKNRYDHTFQRTIYHSNSVCDRERKDNNFGGSFSVRII